MQAVILSAGASSRFWPINGRHKSLIRIMGKPLVYWLIASLEEKGIKEVMIVQGPGKEVERDLNDFNFKIPVNVEFQCFIISNFNIKRNYSDSLF